MCIRDTPGGPVVKNPPSKAGDVGSIPGGGSKIPHATGQLRLQATTAEPRCPCYTTKSPRPTTKAWGSQINKYFKKCLWKNILNY